MARRFFSEILNRRTRSLVLWRDLGSLDKHDKRKCLGVTNNDKSRCYSMGMRRLFKAPPMRKKIIELLTDHGVCMQHFAWELVAEGTICLCCGLYAVLAFCFLVSSRVCTISQSPTFHIHTTPHRFHRLQCPLLLFQCLKRRQPATWSVRT
jgi:hypothetical protein